MPSDLIRGRTCRAGVSGGRQNRPQDVPEDAELHLKRLRAVILVISPGRYDDEIKLRDNADVLTASTERANPVDFTAIEPRAAEPPQISVEIDCPSP